MIGIVVHVQSLVVMGRSGIPDHVIVLRLRMEEMIVLEMKDWENLVVVILAHVSTHDNNNSKRKL